MSRRLFIQGMLGSYFNQAATLLYGIFSLPLLLNYFGTSLYGIWVLVFGLVGYLNTLSFGIPNALVAMVGKAKGQHTQYQLLRKSVFILSLLVAVSLLLLLILVVFKRHWIIAALGNIPSQYTLAAEQIFVALMAMALIRLPLNLYIQFFTGMNLVYISQIYTGVTFISNIVFVLLAVVMHWGVLSFAIGLMAGQLFISVLACVHVLYRFHHYKHQAQQQIVRYREILKYGFSYFQLGISATLVWSTDNLVISHFLSAAAITPYAVAFKMFSYLFLCFAMANSVLTPMYGHAFAADNWPKINRLFGMALRLLPMLGGMLWIGFIFYSRELISLWTHNPAAFGGYSLMVALGFSGYLSTYVSTYSGLVQGLNIANKVLLAVWMEAILNPILTIVFVQIWGVAGVAVGNGLATLCSMFILLPYYIRRFTDWRITVPYKGLCQHMAWVLLPALLISIYAIHLQQAWLKAGLFVVVLVAYLAASWWLLEQPYRVNMMSLIKRKL